MSAAPRFVLPYQTVIDAAGVPLPGATLDFFLTGSSTRANTYSDPGLTVPNANPVVAGADGRFPAIFLDPATNYKVVLEDATGATIWTADPVSGWFGFATNYAALRGLTTTTSSVVYVIGAATAHDGGQGWFAYDPTDTTSPDNGGTTIVAGTVRWKRLYDGPIYPEWFGAKGDGTTPNDAAFALVLATGLAFAGTDGAIYGLANPLDFSAVTNFSAETITFKDLTPGASDRKFLYGSGNASVRMSRVTVLRNGTGGGGSFGTAAAMWIASAAYIDIVELEVTGNDAGAGLHLVGCAGGSVKRAYIHDMTAGTPSSANPGDGADQIAGIWLDGCTGVTVEAPDVRNLLTQCVDYGPENINTRAITGGGPGRAVAITDGFVTNVDQGYDITGDAVMTSYQITASRAEYCRKFGFKAVITASHGRLVNCYAYRCTLDGFILQGSNPAVSPATDNLNDVRLIDCVAEESGYNVGTYYPGLDTFGFRIDVGSADPTYPRNCWLVNCHAFGGTNMKTAFENSVGDSYVAQDRNRLINCTAKDFTSLASEGFVDGYSLIGLETDLTVADSTDTLIAFDRAHHAIDGFHFLPGSGEMRTPTTDLVFAYATRVSIVCVMPFNQDGTGNRACFGQINGETINGGRDIRTANMVSETTPMWSADRTVAAGDVLRIYVNQTSGGGLVLNAGDLILSVTDLNSAQQLVLSV